MSAQMDPDATLDWAFDWSAWLADGETITSHETVPDGVTVDSSSESAGVVTVWVSGGQLGSARVTCRITTSAGRVDDRTRMLYVRER